MSNNSKKIFMMAGSGASSIYMYNGLKDHFAIDRVIVERSQTKEDKSKNRKKFIKRRIKRLGYLEVTGQILFQAIVPKFLTKRSKIRAAEIRKKYDLNDTPIPESTLASFKSINAVDCIEFLKNEQPDLIIVNGTRIISKKVLNSCNATFINTHAGITPIYRGVHGGYWAMAKNDREHCGVTVHLVDPGIDTGGIIYQKNINPGQKDNFITYTLMQIGEGIQLMKRAITDFTKGELKEIAAPSKVSQLYYHPTLWYYLYKRIFHGVK